MHVFSKISSRVSLHRVRWDHNMARKLQINHLHSKKQNFTKVGSKMSTSAMKITDRLYEGENVHKEFLTEPVKMRDRAEAFDAATVNVADTKSAFNGVSTQELLRQYALFKICSIQFFAKNQEKLLKVMRRVLGRRVFEFIMKNTFYGQFLAGENSVEIQNTVKKQIGRGVSSMYAYTVNEGTDFMGNQLNDERQINKINFEALQENIKMASEITEGSTVERPQWTTKMTFLTSLDNLRETNKMILYNRHILDKLSRGKGGDSQMGTLTECVKDIMENEVPKTAEKYGLPVVQGPSTIHNFESYSYSMSANLALNSNADFRALCEESGLGTPSVFTAEFEKDLVQSWDYLKDLCMDSERRGLCVSMDAEQSYLQAAIDMLTIDAFRVVNKKRVVIHLTLQSYLKEASTKIQRLIDLCNREDLALGVKLVRGGYMEQEKNLAQANGSPDPINESFEHTSAMYLNVAQKLLAHLQERPEHTQIIFATHNTDTVNNLISIIKEMGIEYGPNQMAFVQLLGMRDYIATSLATLGYPARKLLHYGPVEQAMIYMSRRLVENQSGLNSAELETSMRSKELTRRFQNVFSGSS